jgi:Family of unknown function (DUF6527)
VVTPFAPTDWKLTFNGEAVSLWPSIGNWNFPCRSHYVIENDRVIEARPWSNAQVAAERERDRRAKARYYGEEPALPEIDGRPLEEFHPRRHSGFWSAMKRWWAGS